MTDGNSYSPIPERLANRYDLMMRGERKHKARVENLKKLHDKYTWTEIADRCGVNGAYLSQIANEVRQARGKNPRRLSDDYAEKIERGMGMPPGSMDVPPGEATKEDHSNVSDGTNIKGRVPLVSWVQAGSAQEAIDLFQPGVADEWVPTSAPIREHTYALKVEGESMAPTFKPGWQIIVEPDMQAENGYYVIARNEEGDTTFKRLVIDAGVHLLVPENKQYPTLRLEDGYEVIGVVRRAEIVLC